MKVKYNQFLAVIYGDMFSYPLTKAEMMKREISGKGRMQEVIVKDGLYFLKGRERLVKLRKERERISDLKMLKLRSVVKELQKIATIEGIFVTGSLAVNNASSESDMDLMIVVTPGYVWTTRLRVLWTLRKLDLLRDEKHIKDRICTNIFLDSNQLEILQKNLYTAHEIVQAKCVFDRGTIEKRWVLSNLWVREFLPKAFKNIKGKAVRERTKGSRSVLELVAFGLQYLYMKPKMTNEKVGLNYAFFHPIDGAKLFLQRYQKRVASLA